MRIIKKVRGRVKMWLCLLMLVTVVMLATAGAAAPPDPFALWKKGAFRGANVMVQQSTAEDLPVLRSWGANLAEIPVSNIYDANPPYAFRPDNLDRLDRAVEAAEQAGLYVVLTCREGPGRADFNKSYEIWQDGKAQEAYARMWRRLAEHYRGRSSIVGYDLMCEPHPDKHAEEPLGDWNALAKQITVEIREVDTQTPIIVNSIGWAYPKEFDRLQPTGDARTVYEVHMYDPHYYTHQKPGENVTYPGFEIPWEQGVKWDKAAIEKRLAPVRVFEEKYHVPIFMGEFGCARYAPGAEQWLRDQFELYEQYHWSWAYWAFREWDVMDIEKTADAADKARYPDTPLLRLFKQYYANDTVFFPPAKGEKGLPPLPGVR